LAKVDSSFSLGQTETLFGGEDTSLITKELQARYKKVGDLGAVAANWIPEVDSTLSLKEVYEQLAAVARISGTGSQDEKMLHLASLINAATPTSAKFIVRIIMGKLRLGFSAMTMLDALSWAVTGGKLHRKELELAYQKQADIGVLAEVYLKNHTESKDNLDQVLSNYSVTSGIPVVPALCHRLNTSQEIIDKMGEVIAEPKYDGLRVQIHFKRAGFEDGSKIKAFTRNLEDATHMFPELEELATAVTVDSLVLDSEAIGYNTETGELLPFQETMTRKRKHNITEASQKVPIKFFVFDVMLIDESELLSTSLQERKTLLENLFSNNSTFIVAPFVVTKNPTVLREYHEKQLAKGLEGAVIKKIDSDYQGGRKGWKWVKIKEEEGSTGKLKDTLDVIIMGYYAGRGKRSQFGIGALLVGVLDADDAIRTIAKVGTGLTEKRLVSLKEKCDVLRVLTKPKNYHVSTVLEPDVWVQPDIVIEVAADEITRSPNHTAKVALRFPRLITVRKDKSWQDATTVVELESL